MLKKVNDQNIANQAYKYIGKNELGYNEYLVDIKENNRNNKSVINLDDALSDCIPDDFYTYDWEQTSRKEIDENSFTENDFYRMDFKTALYHVYKQLVSFSSSLSDIKEVLSDGNKTK